MESNQWRSNPGLTNLSVDELRLYESMNREDKMLVEIQAQTRSIRNIQSNVQFFFWITIIGIVSQIVIYVYLTK
ncbi:MAG: hypothetical protein CMP60_01035 [Flavobacteriales bacterium]|nr:hypothetical protein [Flavobacteriales bacterium]